MEMKPYIVYVKVNDLGYVIAINSSAFLADPTGWVKIDEGYGDKYHHAQGNYFSKPVMTINGVCYYKLIDGEVVECTAEEIAEQEEANKPESEVTTDQRITDLEEAMELLLSGVTE